MSTTTDDVLVETLRIAVALRMAELDVMEPANRQQAIATWAKEAANVLPYRGDQLLFRTEAHKCEGGTADTFNHLARGLAALAYAPGGVRFAGIHWEGGTT